MCDPVCALRWTLIHLVSKYWHLSAFLSLTHPAWEIRYQVCASLFLSYLLFIITFTYTSRCRYACAVLSKWIAQSMFCLYRKLVKKAYTRRLELTYYTHLWNYCHRLISGSSLIPFCKCNISKCNKHSQVSVLPLDISCSTFFFFVVLSTLNKIPIPNRNTEVRQQLMFRKLGHMMSIYIFRHTQQGQTWHWLLTELLLWMYSQYARHILTPLSRGRKIKKDLMRFLNFSNMKISWNL